MAECNHGSDDIMVSGRLGSYTAAATLFCVLNERETGEVFDFSIVKLMAEVEFKRELDYFQLEYMKDVFEAELEKYRE